MQAPGLPQYRNLINTNRNNEYIQLLNILCTCIQQKVTKKANVIPDNFIHDTTYLTLIKRFQQIVMYNK